MLLETWKNFFDDWLVERVTCSQTKFANFDKKFSSNDKSAKTEKKHIYAKIILPQKTFEPICCAMEMLSCLLLQLTFHPSRETWSEFGMIYPFILENGFIMNVTSPPSQARQIYHSRTLVKTLFIPGKFSFKQPWHWGCKLIIFFSQWNWQVFESYLSKYRRGGKCAKVNKFPDTVFKCHCSYQSPTTFHHFPCHTCLMSSGKKVDSLSTKR